MAEGLLGGLWGDEEDAPEARAAEEALAGAEAFAAALAADHAKYDPHVAEAATHFLRDQSRLLKEQTEQLSEERALRLRHLKNQSRESKIRRVGQRIRVGMQATTALIAGAVAVIMATAIWDAAHDHGLVVEAFSVPPDLAQHGLTGQVVAKQVLDRLSALQAQTDSIRAPGSYQNNWGRDLKVEIPETGISIGEIRAGLRDWLGHETHISGEVYRTPTGLTVTARAGEDSAKSFSGTDAEYDKLIQQAAEAVYARTQPYRYAQYLQFQKRFPESYAILEGLTHSPDQLERAWAHLGIGRLQYITTGDLKIYVNGQRAALKEISDFAPALGNLAAAEQGLEHDEEAVYYTNRFLDARQSIQKNVSPETEDTLTASALLEKARAFGDYAEATSQARIVANSSSQQLSALGTHSLAILPAFNHDLPAARAAALGLPPADSTRPEALGLAAMDAGDPASIALFSQMASLDAARSVPDTVLRSDTPWLALAKARFGDLAGASALIASTPTDCYLCVRARGTIAAARGDRTEANRWFAEAIRQGPDLPQAFIDRGKARLGWGDADGAAADAKQASHFSPHNADALKLWGDVLARQGDWRAAREKYDTALAHAPAWTAARQTRDAAARRG
jgi:hypothetical protein